MTKREEIRDMARCVAEIAHSANNRDKREILRLFNDRIIHPCPVFLSLDSGALRDIISAECSGLNDPAYRIVETELRKALWYASLDSDIVIEPWVNMNAIYRSDTNLFGVKILYSEIGDTTKFYPTIESPDDIERLHIGLPMLDQTGTENLYTNMRELLSGILDVRVEWRYHQFVFPILGRWITRLIGQQRFFEWCIDYPEAVNKLISEVTTSFRIHNQRISGDMLLTDNHCYFSDFPWCGDPVPNPKLCDLYTFSNAEDFTGISPDMVNEFFLAYLRPLFAMFSRTAFGCCESLDGLLAYIKTLSNLWRVTISERTDRRRAVDELGDAFILSVRPTMANVVYGDEDDNRKELKEIRDIFKDTDYELNCPGIMTFNGDARRYHTYARLSREVLSS